MRPGDVAGMPLALELSNTHGIEMLWTEANPEAPRPWEATDGGWSWRLLYDEDLPLPEVEQAAVLPGLVTIGTATATSCSSTSRRLARSPSTQPSRRPSLSLAR